MKQNNATESQHQIALFDWFELAKKQYPELQLAFHIPNGGHRHVSVAKKLKAEGVKAGVPDIFLPAPIGKYNGLFIELKNEKGKPSDKQLWWLNELDKQGYKVVIAYGWLEAKQYIINYLNGVDNGVYN